MSTLSTMLVAGELPVAFACREERVSGSSPGDPKMAAAIPTLFDAVRAGGGRISYDPNIRRAIASNPDCASMISKALAGTDFILPSSDDMSGPFPGDSEAEAVIRVFEAGAGRVAMKEGGASCACFMPGEFLSLPGHVVDVVDATGAGDCFYATFVALTALGSAPTRSPGARRCRGGAARRRSRFDGRQPRLGGREGISRNARLEQTSAD